MRRLASAEDGTRAREAHRDDGHASLGSHYKGAHAEGLKTWGAAKGAFGKEDEGTTLTHRLQQMLCILDALLGVDMSYRYVAAVTAALDALHAGAIGRPHAADLVFHNAYGPDKAWVRDAELAGGGALIDLGCHLVWS